MKVYNNCFQTILLTLLLLVWGGQSACASNYYSKVYVKAVQEGNGKVYVSYKNEDNNAASNAGASAEAQSDADRQAQAPNHTYYLYAFANEGYKFDAWYTDEDCNDGRTTANSITFKASSTNSKSPTTKNYYANFIGKYNSRVNVRTSSPGRVSVSTTNDGSPTGTSASAEMLNSANATHTYYLKTETTDDTWKFVGWYEGNNKVSDNQEYAYEISNPEANNDAPVTRTFEARYEKVYFIQHVQSGLWLQNNDRRADIWHTSAELGIRGLDFTITTVDDGYYLKGLNSASMDNVFGDGRSFSLENTARVWTLTDQGNGTYKIASGGVKLGTTTTDINFKQNNIYTPATNDVFLANEDNATWRLVTKEERLAELASATEDNPIDVTWLIGNPDDANANPRDSRWTRQNTGNRHDADNNWNRGARVIEAWDKTTMSISQLLTDIPNGKYQLIVQGFYRDGETGKDAYDYNTSGKALSPAKIFANDEEQTLMSILHDAAAAQDSEIDEKKVFQQEAHQGVWVPMTLAHCNHAMNQQGLYVNEPLQVDVAGGQLNFGVRKSGDKHYGDWVVISGFKLEYLGNSISLEQLLAALQEAIDAVDAWKGATTDPLQNALNEALTTARGLLESTDKDAIAEATTTLNSALVAAKAVDCAALRATLDLAKAEGITNTSAAETYLSTATTNDNKDNLLRQLRNYRKLKAIEKVDISKIACSEPAEGDYYLYNVGAGVFFSTSADWGTHIAIDNPGMLIKFTAAESGGKSGFKLSGNGWDGMYWEGEYWDMTGENILGFVPVEGKDKVYSLCEYDNDSWHFVYDPEDDVCDDNTHYWNAVQKRQKSRNEYVNDPYAQWMIVSPEAYKEAWYKATESDPLDMTFMIQNPNFTKSKIGGVVNWDRGWTNVGIVNKTGDRDPSAVIEWYETDANMYQEINGLPAGKYLVTAYGFYRDGSSDNEAGKVGNSETLIQNAFLYAEGKNNVEKALPNVTSEAGKMPGVGGTREGVDGEFPVQPEDADQYFQTGRYKTTTDVVEVGPDGKLKIGVKSTYNDVSGSWVVVGNFRLTCLGQSTIDEFVISDADELDDFAANVNAGVKVLSAKLTADVVANNAYVPAGNVKFPFNGTFDGQGNAVTLNISGSGTGVGLIGYAADGATISDVVTKGSVTGEAKVAGVVGYAVGGGTVTLEKVGNEATIRSTGNSNANAAGLVGCAIENTIIVATYCYNTGAVSGQDGQCAALCGWSQDKDNGQTLTTFTNCWNSGAISNIEDQAQLYRNSGKVTATNCYDLTATGNQGTKLVATAEASGELCYKLNEGQDEIVWRQTVGAGHPVFTGNQVFLNGTYANVAANVTLNETQTFGTTHNFEADVTIIRTLKENVWNTFCVPVDMENSDLGAEAEVKALTGLKIKGDHFTMTFAPAECIEAGKPYMVRVQNKITELSLGEKTVKGKLTEAEETDLGGSLKFIGVYTNGEAPYNSFIISNNLFYLVDSAVTLKAFRGYITAKTDGGNAPTLTFTFDEEETAITEMEDGALTVSGTVYNLAGQQLPQMQKGINIVNGKKVLKK